MGNLTFTIQTTSSSHIPTAQRMSSCMCNFHALSSLQPLNVIYEQVTRTQKQRLFVAVATLLVRLNLHIVMSIAAAKQHCLWTNTAKLKLHILWHNISEFIAPSRLQMLVTECSRVAPVLYIDIFWISSSKTLQQYFHMHEKHTR